MARVDFYILSEAGEHARHAFACRLAEKAYRLDNTVHIETATQVDAERIDELLWTFRDGSFVPHHLLGSANLDSPVTIGSATESTPGKDLLINLSTDIPPCAESFARVAELVSADADGKQQSRQRFVRYRDAGHELDTHKL